MGTADFTGTSTNTVIIMTSCDCTATGSTFTVHPHDATTSVAIHVPPPPRRILVSMPKKWKKKRVLAFADLINKETSTGWKVEMVIVGEVIITDPEVETRKLKRMLPLILNHASEEDRAKIEDFVQ